MSEYPAEKRDRSDCSTRSHSGAGIAPRRRFILNLRPPVPPWQRVDEVSRLAARARRDDIRDHVLTLLCFLAIPALFGGVLLWPWTIPSLVGLAGVIWLLTRIPGRSL